jgi:hypothetical protein
MTAWDIESTAEKLMQRSTKAQENGERYALLTAQNAAGAVERNAEAELDFPGSSRQRLRMARRYTDGETWHTSYRDGVMSIDMTEEDARLLRAAARKAGLSAQVYIQRCLGITETA